MKKFTKISLITAAVFFCLGLILWGVGVANGGGYKGLRNDFLDGKFNIEYHRRETKMTSGNMQSSSIELPDKMNLNVSVGGTHIRFKDSDDGKFNVEADGINISWGMDDEDIDIGTENKIFGNKSAGDITVYVPSDYKFKNVDIECGAGEVYIDSLSARNLDLDIGAGEAVLNNVDVRNIDIECGAGDIQLNGNVEKGGDIDCSMGNITLNLEQPYEYYDYNIDCSMGEVNINDNNYSGLGIDKKLKNSPEHELNIECSMGQIDINTK